LLHLFSISIISSSASGADLQVVKTCSDCDAYLYIIGKIEVGDDQRVDALLRQHGPSVSAIMLRSIGGSMYDSINIGTLARQLLLDTFAPYYPASGFQRSCHDDDRPFGVSGAPCTCVSGCFLIWLGGVHRYGVIVGMHRPWDTSRKMGSMPYEKAAPQYAQ